MKFAVIVVTQITLQKCVTPRKLTMNNNEILITRRLQDTGSYDSGEEGSFVAAMKQYSYMESKSQLKRRNKHFQC